MSASVFVSASVAFASAAEIDLSSGFVGVQSWPQQTFERMSAPSQWPPDLGVSLEVEWLHHLV